MLELPLVPFPLQNLETRRKEADFGARVGALRAAGAFREATPQRQREEGNPKSPRLRLG